MYITYFSDKMTNFGFQTEERLSSIKLEDGFI